jgi:cell division protein FtsI/penicillin-binding protein 2
VNPQIAICVMIENAGATGGTIAAPIAQKIMERYFALQKLDREKAKQQQHSDSTKVPREIAQAR